MRFERLDILRYGALTDRSLVFRADAKLHIVYGPNEAGKSSALSAISDLLFGFPTAAQYSFQHDPASLRVGASVASRDGASLTFRRRRGRKSTLLAATDAEEALADDALTPFLGSLSRDVFERAFGLNSASLRAGGESMLKSGGEIGSLLFSAASGLTGLSEMRKDLEAEADVIYAPRRSKDRLFYQVLDTHEEARRAERDNELKASDWKRLIAEQAEVESDLQTVSSERQETKRALESLRLLQRLDPIIREIDRERESWRSSRRWRDCRRISRPSLPCCSTACARTRRHPAPWRPTGRNFQTICAPSTSMIRCLRPPPPSWPLILVMVRLQCCQR